MRRRQLLARVGLFSVGAIAFSYSRHWLARGVSANPNNPRLVTIFLRGAADGLSAVIPYGEASYYEYRPKIAIPKPNQGGKVESSIDLDGYFALHPALKPLVPLWQERQLAFVHASGSTDETRSHFEAQDYMESGTPGLATTGDGWMNRLMAVLSGANPIQAVNVGERTPRILAGTMPVASISSGRKASAPIPLDRPQIASAFDRLYDGNDPLSQTYKEARLARQELLGSVKALEQEQRMADNGAPPAVGFASDARRIGQIMARDPRVQLAFMDIGGWDTHINQGNSTGQLARNLDRLAQGLVALQQGLGEVYRDTTIVVLSEFGRTVRENGNGGTDHGHGNVIWVLGGGIRGGKVYGKWTGLSNSELHEGRDLAVTTDFRDVLATLLDHRFNLDGGQIGQVFPNFKPQSSLSLV